MYKKDKYGNITKFYYKSGQEFDQIINCLYKTKGDTIWIGTGSEGPYLIDPIKKYVELLNITTFPINIIYIDKKGLLWIGNMMGGLQCYNKANNEIIQFISKPNDLTNLNGKTVLDIHEDKKGRLWIGTNIGLNKYDYSSEKFIHFTEKNGLSSNAIFSILEDDNDHLWLSTRKGISKFDMETKSFQNYDVSYGLPANGFNAILGYKTSDGEMYFGGPNGLIRFHPDSIKDNPFIPPIEITSAKEFEKDFPDKKARLTYNENFLSFEFTALSYISSERNQYAYKMEGLDKDWIYSGTRRYASYPNLDPGEYIFRVKGSNNDGVWNESGTSISIIITPPWWETWWFKAVSLLILFAAAGSTIRYIEMKKINRKIEQLEQERALERERTRILTV